VVAERAVDHIADNFVWVIFRRMAFSIWASSLVNSSIPSYGKKLRGKRIDDLVNASNDSPLKLSEAGGAVKDGIGELVVDGTGEKPA
jgi:hypothetical protein